MAEVRPPTVKCEILEVEPSGFFTRQQGQAPENLWRKTRIGTHEYEQHLLSFLLALTPTKLEEPVVRKAFGVGVDGNGSDSDCPNLRVQFGEQISLRGLSDVRGR